MSKQTDVIVRFMATDEAAIDEVLDLVRQNLGVPSKLEWRTPEGSTASSYSAIVRLKVDVERRVDGQTVRRQPVLRVVHDRSAVGLGSLQVEANRRAVLEDDAYCF